MRIRIRIKKMKIKYRVKVKIEVNTKAEMIQENKTKGTQNMIKKPKIVKDALNEWQNHSIQKMLQDFLLLNPTLSIIQLNQTLLIIQLVLSVATYTVFC